MSRLRTLLIALPKSLRRQKLLSALCGSRIVTPLQLLEFNVNARAWVDLRDAESRATYLSQTFWPEFHPLVAAFLRAGGHFFDLGANFGLVTFGVVPLVQGLDVGFHLFEANPRIIPVLERSTRLWPDERFTVNHCCVTDRPGSSGFTLPDSCWGHGFISAEGEPVPNLVLDDYIAERGIERIGFMKVDIEGWEVNALRGARHALTSGKIEAGFVEIAPDSLRRSGTTAHQLLHMLASFGFDSYFCGLWDSPDPHGLRWYRVPFHGISLRFADASHLPRGFVQGDVLMIHRSHPLSPTLRKAVAA